MSEEAVLHVELGCRIEIRKSEDLNSWHHSSMRGRWHGNNVLVNFHGQVVAFDYHPVSVHIRDTHGTAELAEQILERWLKQNPPAAQPPTSNAGDGGTGEDNADLDEGSANGGAAERPDPTSSDRPDGEDASDQGNNEDNESDTDASSTAKTDAQGYDREPQSENTPDAAPGQSDVQASQPPSHQPQTDTAEPDVRAGVEAESAVTDVRHAQHVTQRIENAGIELIGVGIMDESLRAIVADTIVVHQLVRPVRSKPNQDYS